MYWIGWWIALFWFWLVLAGEWNRIEVVAAAGAATIAATLAEFARARSALVPNVPLRAVADVPRLLAMVVVDFGIVVWALLVSVARREVVRGSFVARELNRPGDAAGFGARAWVAIASSYSPNAYVLDVGTDARVLVHDLVPNQRSEEPA